MTKKDGTGNTTDGTYPWSPYVTQIFLSYILLKQLYLFHYWYLLFLYSVGDNSAFMITLPVFDNISHRLLSVFRLPDTYWRQWILRICSSYMAGIPQLNFVVDKLLKIKKTTLIESHSFYLQASCRRGMLIWRYKIKQIHYVYYKMKRTEVKALLIKLCFRLADWLHRISFSFYSLVS